MSPTIERFLFWAPRLIGVAITLFLGAFALDAFDGPSIWQNVLSFAIHLAPAALCAALVAAAWRFRWVGTIGFSALAVGYALMVPSRPDWIAAISGPLLVVAILFALSPPYRGRDRADGLSPSARQL